MSSSQWNQKFYGQFKGPLSKITDNIHLQDKYLKDTTYIIQYLSSAKQMIASLQKLLKQKAPNSTTMKALKESGKMQDLIRDIKQKFSRFQSKADVTNVDIILPKWKIPSLISKTSIHSRTNHILNSIASAETITALHVRVESLISHIQRYPEARSMATKEGGIKILLNARKKLQRKICPAREALAVLGYADPLPGNGIRILSIDGGGIRGLLVLEMLKKLEELTGKPTYELFDYFCGVSTGAILTISIGVHHKPLDEISRIYKEISTEVFSQSAIWGTSNLMWSQAYYNTALWEKRLREYLGDSLLIESSRDPNCPKLCAVSAVVNRSRLTAYLFRNYSLPSRVQAHYFGNNNHKLWEAARASAAAPTYFEEFKLGSFIHQDGGILFNNPSAIALHEAKLLWPLNDIQCLVSFGTGRSIPSPNELEDSLQGLNSTSWANKFLKILDSATDTEGVHIILNDLLPPNKYFRFNPYLTEMISMVEINESKLGQLKRDAIMYLRRNEDKFQAAAKCLTQKKSVIQYTKDLIRIQKNPY